MIAVIFWGLLGIFALGFTIALLVLVQEGTVIANDGITVIIRLRDGSEHALPVAQTDGSRPFIPIGKQVAFMPEALTRRQATYMLTPKWKVLLSGLAISLLFLIISVMVYFERFI